MEPAFETKIDTEMERRSIQNGHETVRCLMKTAWHPGSQHCEEERSIRNGAEMPYKMGRNYEGVRKAGKRSIQKWAKTHTKWERYGKKPDREPHCKGKGPYKSGTIRKGIRQRTARHPARHRCRGRSIQNRAEAPYEKGRESECCRIRTKDRYKNGMKIHTKWERYEKKSCGRPHGIPAGAQAAARSRQNGAEVPYEKGMEMGMK